LYEFLLTVHVLCAVIWVGGAVMLHIFGRLATKEGAERQLVFTGQATRVGNTVFAPLWVTIGFLGFLTSFVLGVGYYPRAGRRYGEIAAGDGPGSRAAESIYRRTATVNMVELSILLLVIVAMTTKPG